MQNTHDAMEKADFPGLGTRYLIRSEATEGPRGLPHAFWNPGDEEARLLELISPGAFAQFFADVSPVLSVEGEPDFERVAEIQASYGLSMDFETIEPLIERHGLDA